MQIGKYTFISLVVAGSSKDSIFEKYELDQKDRPRFGRNWWFWSPKISSNGGRFKKGFCTDVSINFLCFSLSFVIFR